MTRWLVDTNILVRFALPHDPLSPVATAAVKQLRRRGDGLHVVAQNLIEFWSVATRPTSSNGLGFSVEQATAEVDRIGSLFPLLADTPSIFGYWRQLVETSRVLGRQAHDARLVAAMQSHGVGHILTFNDQDFRRYPGISVSTPQQEATAALERP